MAASKAIKLTPKFQPPRVLPMIFAPVQTKPKMLIINFKEPMSCLSWAVYGGGYQTHDHAVWLEVSKNGFSGTTPVEFARSRLAQEGIKEAATFMTSLPLQHNHSVTHSLSKFTCRCVATVGLDNARRIGDRPGTGSLEPPVGTINLLVQLSHSLDFNAMLETISLATEARTNICLQAKLLSPISQLNITGTGTDCIIVACPQDRKNHEVYAGKHTEIGCLVGKTVSEAVQKGIQTWLTNY